MLVKPSFRALLLTVLAGTSLAFAGCGAKDAPKSTEVDTTSVNPDDPKSWDKFLQSIEVSPAAREDLGTERASGKRGVFLIYPVGEVRKVGLKKFRIDVTSDFDEKGTLRFTKGSKTLYEAAFDPADLTKESFVVALPAAVVENLGAGDDVKWGLYFSGKKSANVTNTFKVIDKGAATKEISKKIDGNKSLSSTPTIRELARAEILMNYSLFSEAVEVLSEVAASDKTLQAPYLPLANALRRLKLKDSPLYQESVIRASSGTPRGRGLAGGGPGAGIGPDVTNATGQIGPNMGNGTGAESLSKGGPGVVVDTSRPTALKSAGNAPRGLAAGGSVQPGLRVVLKPSAPATSLIDPSKLPESGADAWRAYQETLRMLQNRANDAIQVANDLRAKADAATANSLAAQDAVKTANQKVMDAQKAMDAAAAAVAGNPNDPALHQAFQDAQNALKMAQMQAEGAKAAAETAAQEAENATNEAGKAEDLARRAQELAQTSAQSASTVQGGSGGPMLPKTGDGSIPPPKDPTLTLQQAQSNVQNAYTAVQTAHNALTSALLAQQAAHAAVQAAAGDPVAEAAAAQQLQQANNQFTEAQMAQAAALAAAKAAEEALNSLNGN